MSSLRDRFWSKVDKSGECWNWTGTKRDGYGLIHITRKVKMRNAHRISWEMAFGPIPDGLLVLHRCDNRACVRPDHLFLGTIDQNMQDRNEKQRQARGERSGRATLTDAEVIAIRELLPAGTRAPWGMCRDVAARYGVDRQVITLVWHRHTWRHLP